MIGAPRHVNAHEDTRINTCPVCGEHFIPAVHNGRFCPACRDAVTNAAVSARMRRKLVEYLRLTGQGIADRVWICRCGFLLWHPGNAERIDPPHCFCGRIPARFFSRCITCGRIHLARTVDAPCPRCAVSLWRVPGFVKEIDDMRMRRRVFEEYLVNEPFARELACMPDFSAMDERYREYYEYDRPGSRFAGGVS